MTADEEWKSLKAGDRLAVKLGRDPCACSDLIVDTYMRCLESYDPSKGTFRSYYLTCLRRDILRDKRQMKDMRDGQNTFGHSVLQDLINRESQVDVNELMLRVLEPHERELLLDRYVRDISLWDIGVKHGVLKQTVWNWLEKILKKLRDEVREEP